jgi:hypothetical protein
VCGAVEHHLHHVIDYQHMFQRKDLVSEQLQDEKRKREKLFEMTFTVHRDLVGLVIGTNGSNIKPAQAIAGIERYCPSCFVARICNMYVLKLVGDVCCFHTSIKIVGESDISELREVCIVAQVRIRCYFSSILSSPLPLYAPQIWRSLLFRMPAYHESMRFTRNVAGCDRASWWVAQLRHQSETCALAARSKLEFTQDSIHFPSRMISWILGKNGEHIREIQQKSGVTRIFIGKKSVVVVSRRETHMCRMCRWAWLFDSCVSFVFLFFFLVCARGVVWQRMTLNKSTRTKVLLAWLSSDCGIA